MKVIKITDEQIKDISNVFTDMENIFTELQFKAIHELDWKNYEIVEPCSSHENLCVHLCYLVSTLRWKQAIFNLQICADPTNPILSFSADIERGLQLVEMEKEAKQRETRIPLKDIVNAASLVSGYTIDEIRGKSRSEFLCYVRFVFSTIAYDQGYVYAIIGNFLNNRDHSSIMHHTDRFNDACTTKIVTDEDKFIRTIYIKTFEHLEGMRLFPKINQIYKNHILK